MPKPLKIIVGGYIIGYPLGGLTWHYLNYLLGLHELGHEVWFLEDSGSYSTPYNPTTKTSDADPAYGIEYLRRAFKEFGLPARFCYYSQFLDRYWGLSRQELHELLASADLLLCISAVTPMREDRPRPRRTAVIDTDPVFTQLRMQRDESFKNYYKQFDCMATFGRLIGTSACPLPTHGFGWIPTHQPIALRHWPVVPTGSKDFTTLGKWQHAADRDVQFNGQTFRSSKAIEWMKLIDLPGKVPWRMTLGMEAMPPASAHEFSSHGWQIVDPETASLSCTGFRGFVQNSAGEFTVAKQIYADVPSGWFSDRSAAYLASGRPVVTQATGFDRWLPTGQGLFSYQTAEEAAAALQIIAADYPTHSEAARALAEAQFQSGKVLTELLNQLM
jgi:hypothetical protein